MFKISNKYSAKISTIEDDIISDDGSIILQAGNQVIDLYSFKEMYWLPLNKNNNKISLNKELIYKYCTSVPKEIIFAVDKYLKLLIFS